jgi:tetratricopeptide (TPR) repeat protein/SAM-dependent methyltransferase
MKSRAQGEFAPLARARERLQAGRPDAAELILREWLAGRPDHAHGRHLFGLALVQSGRADAGFAALRRSVELDPAEPMFRRNLGVMLAEHGAVDEARGVLEELVERWPKDALGHDALGTAHQRAGRYAAAIACHERSLALAPAADGAWSNYAAALLGAGRLVEATRSARHALTLNPRNALAALNLGNTLRNAGESAAAAAAYRSAVSMAPELAIAWHNLGMVLREAGDGRAAADCFAAAMRAAPLQPAHAAGFVDAVAAAGWESLPDALMPAALQCLEHEDVDAHGLATGLFHSLATDPRVGPALARAGEALSADDLIALCDARLLRLLERTPVPGVPAEIAFTALRRACLNHVVEDAQPPLPLALACALAQQAFLGEYAWPAGKVEAERADAYAAGRENGRAIACAEDALRVALQAAYRPIATLGLSVRDSDAALPEAFHRMWRDQVEAARQERALLQNLRTLTPIREGVSAAVRAQYEANPYPRWRVAPSLAGALPLPQKLRALFPWLDADAVWPEAPRVLVAGCGTGLHPIATGRLHPTARILAVDISRASLAYAVRRARELGVANVEFAQADLLELGSLSERFDLIECAGVLHHLESPLEGWRVLAGLLAPAGLMKVALYSARARDGVVAARELIAASGFPADPDGIRAARAVILALPTDAPARTVIGSPDFWSLSGCRDLIFHVQEHRFTLPQIGAALEVLGLEFLGFEFPDRVAVERYRRETKGDPLGRSLSDWDHFEARYPDTFAGMYQFWVRRRRVVAHP